jgi:hypothetical protein
LTVALLLSLTLAAGAAAPAPAAGPASLALIVASNRGSQPGRAPLQYADDDGAKYYEVLSTIAGLERTQLLTDFDDDTARLFPALLEKARSPTRAQLGLAVRKLAWAAAELKRAGRATRFYFVFAGHGDVDGGRGFLELADGPFTADDLQQLLRTVDASESHVILDSCNAFFVVNPRKAGGSRFATPRDAAEQLARRLPNVGVFLSTSAKAEVYEWSELQSGVFSHAVRSGLMGAADANGDGQVSYDELAAFVDTAVAAIKNPGFRPKVFSRGPNGEDGRAILELPGERTALVVDQPGPVRLAVRDLDGLRWLDAHTEPGSILKLWFPEALRGRLEVDRLAVERQGARLEASLALPASGPPSRLAELGPSGTTVAMRGAGDIFQALFANPYGPGALAGWQDGHTGRFEALLVQEPVALAPPAAPEACVDPSRPAPWGQPGGPYALLRAGAIAPRLTSSGRLSVSDEVVLGPGLSLAAGVELNGSLAAELEAGYWRFSTTSDFFSYPAPAFPYTPVVGTRIDLQVVPLSASVRLQLPKLRPSPYLLVGGGVAWVHSTFDPPDANATLRQADWVPFLQVGLGAQVEVSARVFVGLEARYLHFSDFHAVESTLRLDGLIASAVIGVRR